MKREEYIKTLSFRFDIDGIGDIGIGLSRLLDIADSFDVRFSFYVNMGRSFNRKVSFPGRDSGKIEQVNMVLKIKNLLRRHGFIGILRTVIENPCIGIKYKDILSKAASSGHELGLHGGMDHVLWQYKLNSMSYEEIEELLTPAYKKFSEFFGNPYGFSSPGFNYNKHVLRLVDELGFLYVGDMEGEVPFMPIIDGERYNHYQIPVNIIGENKASLFSSLFFKGLSEEKIQERIVEEIMKRETAVIYGHPSVEGKKGIVILENVIKIILNEGYKIIPLKELISLKLEKKL